MWKRGAFEAIPWRELDRRKGAFDVLRKIYAEVTYVPDDRVALDMFVLPELRRQESLRRSTKNEREEIERGRRVQRFPEAHSAAHRQQGRALEAVSATPRRARP